MRLSIRSSRSASSPAAGEHAMRVHDLHTTRYAGRHPSAGSSIHFRSTQPASRSIKRAASSYTSSQCTLTGRPGSPPRTPPPRSPIWALRSASARSSGMVLARLAACRRMCLAQVLQRVVCAGLPHCWHWLVMVPAFRLEWWLVSWGFLAGRLGPLFLFALLGDLADEHAADVVLLVPLVGLVEHVGRVLHQVRLFECLGCLDGGHGERVADLDVLAAAEGLEVGERFADVFLQCDGLAADGFGRVETVYAFVDVVAHCLFSFVGSFVGSAGGPPIRARAWPSWRIGSASAILVFLFISVSSYRLRHSPLAYRFHPRIAVLMSSSGVVIQMAFGHPRHLAIQKKRVVAPMIRA
nr:MAG TPA: hypothetical protein [Caudoviricetes sp.]